MELRGVCPFNRAHERGSECRMSDIYMALGLVRIYPKSAKTCSLGWADIMEFHDPSFLGLIVRNSPRTDGVLSNMTWNKQPVQHIFILVLTSTSEVSFS